MQAARLVRRTPYRLLSLRRELHEPVASSAGVLLHSQLSRGLRRNIKRSWPFGANYLHNVPAVRAISFARVLPNLALKLVRIPAMFGGAMIAGLAYLQYQATRESLGRLNSPRELMGCFGRGGQLCDRYGPENR